MWTCTSCYELSYYIVSIVHCFWRRTVTTWRKINFFGTPAQFSRFFMPVKRASLIFRLAGDNFLSQTGFRITATRLRRFYCTKFEVHSFTYFVWAKPRPSPFKRHFHPFLDWCWKSCLWPHKINPWNIWPHRSLQTVIVKSGNKPRVYHWAMYVWSWDSSMKRIEPQSADPLQPTS